ncbi:hypothetical protein V6N11_016029 [Hibiscus sabdariffa]|uniref:Uncharacterized protein n=1 Tax=Hibiscus sabdariffa TaxID=183260 RepID=A0ABR2TTS2_9ROSI
MFSSSSSSSVVMIERAAVAVSLPHQPRSNALSLALSSTLQFVVSFIFVYFDAAPFFFSVAYTHSSVYLTVPSIIIGSFRKAKFNNFRELLRLSSLTMFSNSNFKDKVLHAMHIGH